MPDSRRKRFLAKCGAGVLALLTLLSVPGVVGAFGDALEYLGDHLLTVILAVLAVGFLVAAYWDGILRALHIHTPRAIDRELRAWLDSQGYAVQRVPANFGPFPGFAANVIGPGSDIHLTVMYADDPRRVDIVWGGQVGPGRHQDAMGHATPPFMRDLMVELHRVFLAAPTTSFAWENKDDPGEFRVAISAHLPVEELTFTRFFEVVQTVRKCGIAVLTVLNNAAESLIEVYDLDPPEAPVEPPQA